MNDPAKVMRALGLERGAERQSAGVTVRCPVHDDADPSCSLTRGPDGTLRARCFACGWTGDVLGLVAAVYALHVRRDFREVLLVAADLAGLHQLASELRSKGTRAPDRPLPPAPEPEAPRDYPPAVEVEAVWQDAVAVAQDGPSERALGARGLSPGPELARALRGGQALPGWARYRGESWLDGGYRVVLPVYAPSLELRSLRAWQVVLRDPTLPKRLPPAGHRATGLCLANPEARALLASRSTIRLLVVEGESDYLTACATYPGCPVLGVGSGAWDEAWARAVPLGSEVTVHTHHDDAGRRYAAHIQSTLARRAVVTRSRP